MRQPLAADRIRSGERHHGSHGGAINAAGCGYGTTFSRPYGQTNPLEDYATTFDTYFMNVYHGNPFNHTVVQAKHDNLELLFSDLRTV